MASHFFKIILERSLQDGKLQVPNNFMKKYGGDMPNPLFLKPPDGTLWEIFWTEYEDGGVWFDQGWKEVAEYYSLDHGHLVVFKYEKGTCHIGVNIFDMSATEIKYPLHGNLEQNGDNHDDDEEDDSVEFLSEMPQKKKKKKKKKKEPEEAETTSNKLKMQELEEDIGGSSFSTKKCPKSKAVVFKEKMMKPLTHDEKVQALQRVSTFKSKNPYFKIAIQPAYIFNGLCVPARFVQQYLKNKEEVGDVLLKVSDGRSWFARYKIWVNEVDAELELHHLRVHHHHHRRPRIGLELHPPQWTQSFQHRRRQNLPSFRLRHWRCHRPPQNCRL
ncbi:B3 domain-containing transcription factor VRN1-like isoform X1 [Senna tora]|uniref:B3 domain-containing transcription factor VRN1-like isoform X1 n=1 Tax=Senna tora TaxID=362788 RepID=A0A834STG8_9FABA|nr:B3 domain-containing transcription factor VRN1-like isoform X1 [Senna tora]